MATEKRIEILDGLRAIAIALVIGNHYFEGLTFKGKFLVAPLFEAGWSGVDLFFILSGFLVGGILFRNQKAENLLRVFYLRRALRILVPYYVLIFAGIIGTAWFGYGLKPSFWYKFFLHAQSLWFAYSSEWTVPFLNVTWSLAIEEYFYLIFPAALLWLGEKNIVRICLGMIFILPPIRAAIVYFEPAWFLGTLVLRPEGIALGVLIAHAWKTPGYQEKFKRLSPSLKILWLGLIAVFIPMFTGKIFYKYSYSFIFGIMHPLLSIFFATSLVVALGLSSTHFVSRLLCAKPVVYFGRISYSTYLLHYLVLWVYHNATADYSVPGAVACLCVTLALSAASFELYEKRLVAIGHRISYRFSKPRNEKARSARGLRASSACKNKP